jgi:uncharacterized glyoxalase superfamily protein PhnB
MTTRAPALKWMDQIQTVETAMILEAFTRVFVDPDAIEPACAFYRALLGGEQTMRFNYPEAGLELAAISSPRLSVLIIAGTAEKRRPFEATRLTVRVETLESAIDILVDAGAEQLEPIQPTPVGRKTRFRHADGLIVEYVENTPRA